MLDSMFHLPLPWLEKVLRPIIVYLFLVVFLRIFGKRELAQLNPFDLVVLLSLSNTVQNAIIGNDNSITGGAIGALALLAINWLLSLLLFKSPKADQILEGTSTVLIRDGVVDQQALKKETMTEKELLSVIHKQGLDYFSEVKTCTLEPNGSFYVETLKPGSSEVRMTALQDAVERLTSEVSAMRAQLSSR